MMTLEEAIKHCKDVALSCTNKECALEHFQLLKWLQEYSSILKKQGERKPKNESTDTCDSLSIKSKEFPAGETRDFGYFSESADKIEPKFHEGEWIVLIATGSAYQVEKIKNYEYTLRHISGGSVRLSNEKLIREWTIQDAKAGNVLYCKADNGIEYFVMNKGINKCGNIDSYFRYNSLGDFGVDIPSVLSTEDHNITPATKEQRDMLFQKMKEAGYEWDAEKKELKKLTQQEVTKTSDQEEDFIEIPFGAYDSELIEATYFIPEGCYAVIVNDKVIIKKGERKPAWREEDERRVKDTIYFLDTAKKHYASTVELDACIDWLKSLKDKVQPQPQPKQGWSKEDEDMLDDAIGAVGAADYYTYDDKQEIENWLKSLKQRIGENSYDVAT